MKAQFGNTTFECPDDFAGNVTMSTAEGFRVSFPCEDIMKFCSAIVRHRRVQALDDMTWQDILAGK